MRMSEKLARRWMPGFREGASGKPHRAAWEHPRDIVREIRDVLANPMMLEGAPGPVSLVELEDLGWLHDIIEDGRKEDGSPVLERDLIDQGIGEDLVDGVVMLTHWPDEEKDSYLARLLNAASWKVRIVKGFDRLCNLKEGAPLFKDRRWERYVRETDTFILPMLRVKEIPRPLSAWFEVAISAILKVRPADPKLEAPCTMCGRTRRLEDDDLCSSACLTNWRPVLPGKVQ